MMIRRSTVLAVALLLAGCAGTAAGPGAAGDASSAAPPASAGASQPPVQTSSAPVPPSTGKAKPAAGQRLTGQVEAGVEPGCLVLTGARGTHLLIVPAKLKRALEAGDTVTITGRAEPGMVTTCQQGTPFVVTAVE